MDGVDRGCGILLGTAADAVFGDPRRWHPVAGFGRAAGAAERALWVDSRARGAVFTAVCVAGAAVVGSVAQRMTSSRRGARIGMTAAATWAVLGARSLVGEARVMHRLLESGDLAAARERVTHLVGRETDRLDEGDLARAATESIAENTSDAVVAPLLWGAVGGIPGLLAYRAINTLDAMVGHRSPRFRRFGWASARLDDLANYLPARVCAALVAATSRTPMATWPSTRRWARAHPSPNSGWCESAFAARLGLRFGGANRYGGRIEHRPTIGAGRAPDKDDLLRAARLTSLVTAASALLAAGIAVASGHVTARIATSRRRR